MSQAVNSASMKLEGIVSKRMESSYRSGKSKNWIKVKCAQWKEDDKDRGDLFMS